MTLALVALRENISLKLVDNVKKLLSHINLQVLHRDIKTANVLLCKTYDKTQTFNVGSPYSA